MLKFNDGVNINTSGPLRRLQLSDGLYVVGEGMLIPCNSEEEVKKFLEKDLISSAAKASETFGDDELERYAEEMQRKKKNEKTSRIL